MGGDEQPDRFLLCSQQLGLLVLLARDRRVHGAGEPRAWHERTALSDRLGACAHPSVGAPGRLFLQVEDRALADLRVLLELLPGGLCRLQDLHHPLAARAGRAEGPALDERLDRLLVDRAVVNALAEVPQRGGRAALLPRPFDRLDRLIANALDGIQAEANVAVDDRELVV